MQSPGIAQFSFFVDVLQDVPSENIPAFRITEQYCCKMVVQAPTGKELPGMYCCVQADLQNSMQ